jgi:hypothetical protein
MCIASSVCGSCLELRQTIFPLLTNRVANMEFICKILLIHRQGNSDIGERGRVVVKVLCYKPEGREFETQ